MRKKLVVGNWKMNMTRSQASAAVESLAQLVDSKSEVDVAICPPYLSIETVSNVLKGHHVRYGAQDEFWATAGAFTGNVSAVMLADAGCTFCIVGHSETRGRFGKLEIPESTIPYFSETDETVNLKIKALIQQSIHPILCVGETLGERTEERTDVVIAEQLKGALAGISADDFANGVVAYEPVWAIGTGKTCDTPEANRVCAFIRTQLALLLGAEAADSIRILYGGSVKSGNAKDLFSQSDIDGGLVGGASLDPEEFNGVIAGAL